MIKPRIVIDTNILISYVTLPGPTIIDAVLTAFEHCVPLLSQTTFDELRRKLEEFIDRGMIATSEASELLSNILDVAVWIKVIEPVEACRDPDDDQFLSVAVNGKASYIVSGDKDLLALHPFEGIPILTPRAFIALVKKK